MRSRSCPSWCEALAVLVLAGCPARTPPPVAITGPEDVTEARLDALVRELVPLVEEAGGRRFTTVPQTRLGRPADLESVVEQEFRSILGRMIDAPEWVVDVLADDARHGVGGILGKYGVHSKVLYLAPDALFSAAHAAGLAPERAGDVARLILAHELTHALQDQAAGLDAVFHSVVDGEALDVVRMLTEGHANHVERAVAARLGLLDVSARLDLGQGWTDDRGPPTTRMRRA